MFAESPRRPHEASESASVPIGVAENSADWGAGDGDAPGPAARREVLDAVGFVHLHVHSSYSLREGALSIGKLAKLASADQMPALAITDTNNLFGALEFSEKLAKEGIQPIVGAHLVVDFQDGAQIGQRGVENGAGRGGVVLLAKDEQGYRNLMHLASRAWLDPEPGDLPHVGKAKLAGRSDGLIILSGGPAGALDRRLAAGRPDLAEARLSFLESLFADRLYVELQRHGLPAEQEIEPQLQDLAFRHGLPLVATNEAYFASAGDYGAHDALLCIAEGTVIGDPARRQLSPEHRFKSRAEMRDALCRFAGSDAQFGRDRTALRLSAADAQTHFAAFRERGKCRR